MASATSFYDFKPLDKKGNAYPTASLQNKVVLIVNTASKCGFTPQLTDLQKLYKSIRDTPQGADFEMLGFPCNQFNNQNPEDDDGTQNFCMVNYGVEFPILGKTNVNGDDADPLWRWMKNEKPGILGLTRVKWNFEKFLIGKDGKVKGRWASTKKPLDLQSAIEAELKQPGPELPATPAKGVKKPAGTPQVDGTATATSSAQTSAQTPTTDAIASTPGQTAEKTPALDGAPASTSPSVGNTAQTGSDLLSSGTENLPATDQAGDTLPAANAQKGQGSSSQAGEGVTTSAADKPSGKSEL